MTDCIGGEDELEHNCPCGPEGAVRLVDGIVPYRGRVEYCRNGRWWTICNQNRYYWNQNSATVVCRQLGYPSAGTCFQLKIYFSTPTEANGWIYLYIGSGGIKIILYVVLYTENDRLKHSICYIYHNSCNHRVGRLYLSRDKPDSP